MSIGSLFSAENYFQILKEEFIQEYARREHDEEPCKRGGKRIREIRDNRFRLFKRDGKLFLQNFIQRKDNPARDYAEQNVFIRGRFIFYRDVVLFASLTIISNTALPQR